MKVQSACACYNPTVEDGMFKQDIDCKCCQSFSRSPVSARPVILGEFLCCNQLEVPGVASIPCVKNEKELLEHIHDQMAKSYPSPNHEVLVIGDESYCLGCYKQKVSVEKGTVVQANSMCCGIQRITSLVPLAAASAHQTVCCPCLPCGKKNTPILIHGGTHPYTGTDGGSPLQAYDFIQVLKPAGNGTEVWDKLIDLMQLGATGGKSAAPPRQDMEPQKGESHNTNMKFVQPSQSQ